MILDDLAIDRREVFVIDLAGSAAVLALEGFGRQRGQSIGMKGPQDYPTETDGTPGDVARVVDPIDGTANFTRAIAFVANGKVQLGAILAARAAHRISLIESDTADSKRPGAA